VFYDIVRVMLVMTLTLICLPYCDHLVRVTVRVTVRIRVRVRILMISG
jgi:hypothetical protein